MDFNQSLVLGTPDVQLTNNSPEPLFHVNMLVPTWNPYRMYYGDLIAKELESIGISTDIYFDSCWSPWLSRTLIQEVDQWSEGGYDISFVGKPNIGVDHRIGTQWTGGWIGIENLVGKEMIPPNGYNAGYWSSELGKNYYNYRAAESEELLAYLKSTWNRSLYKQNLAEWQKVFYDAQPFITVIDNLNRIYMYSNGLYGVDFAFTPFQSMETVWTDSSYTGTQDQVIIATDTLLEPFNTMLDPYVTTFNFFAPVMDGLVGKTPTEVLILPDGTNHDSWMNTQFGTKENLELYPRIATSFGTFSPDGLQYNITVRDDVYWHDGHQLDAWDAAFSFQARLVSEINYPDMRTLRYLVGEDNKTASHGVYSFEALDIDDDQFFETLSFNFENNQTTYLFETGLLGLYLFPEHILGDPIDHGFNISNDFNPHNQWLVPPLEWENHSFNTGNPSDSGGLRGPIGCGSLVFKGYDAVNSTVYLEKFEDIQWDNKTGGWVINSTNDHFLINSGNLDQMPNSVIIKSMDLNSSVKEMKLGKVNIIDYISFENEYPAMDTSVQDMNDRFKAFNTESQFNVIYAPSASYTTTQIMFLNPKFVASTELNSSDRPFNRKGVRHAISHIVPRESIIEQLYEGMGFINQFCLSSASWGYLSDTDFIAYKQSLPATDGSFPEVAVTSAFDDYDRQLALDWLATEGYNVSFWQDWSPPTDPEWVINEAQQWDKNIQAGTSIEFEINTLRDENNTPSWYWESANVTFYEGDTIRITWLDDPDTTNKFKVEDDESINYPISVTIGGTTLDKDHAQQFGWFILPLVTTDPLGNLESGIHSAQRHFDNSYPLVSGLVWSFDVENDPDLYDIGGSANVDDEINAHIVTSGPWLSKEDSVFNVTYHANSGILKRLLFTNTEGKDASTGIISSEIVNGLNEMEISFSKINVPIPPATTTSTTTTLISTTTQDGISYMHIVLVITTLSIAAILRKKVRR